MRTPYRGRLGLQQRVLPNYRVPFFDMLAAACDDGLGVFAGQPRPGEGIVTGTPRLAKLSAAANVHILRGALYLCHQRGFTSWLEAWNPDALIVEANPRYLATASAVRWMHAGGRPVVGWGLGAPPLKGILSGPWQARRRRFLQQFDALIAYSRRGAREYVDAGFPLERVFIATNSVAPRPSRRPDRKPRAGQATILFVGRLQRRKHVDFLLQACAEMPEPHPRLVIVGNGSERAPLESLARHVYPAAEFAGTKHGAELEPFFMEADLFVLPGTGGLAVQEAMAHGLPVIVAKGDGTQDDLVRGGNGWQTAPEDYAALASTLRLALADVGRLRKMGEESYRIVSEEVNLESMVAAFVEALKSLNS
jgi:glycosyltransferase involved in cell wall biosynthesis